MLRKTRTLVNFLGGFVYNGGVLQTTEVKHSDTAVRTAAHEHIYASCTETHVKDLLVMRNKLSFCCQSRYIPYCTGGIDA